MSAGLLTLGTYTIISRPALTASPGRPGGVGAPPPGVLLISSPISLRGPPTPSPCTTAWVGGTDEPAAGPVSRHLVAMAVAGEGVAGFDTLDERLFTEWDEWGKLDPTTMEITAAAAAARCPPS